MARENDDNESDGKGERIFSMHFRQQDNGDLNVVTKFHKNVSGNELMTMMKRAVHGTLETALRLGEGYGLTTEEVYELIFEKNYTGEKKQGGECEDTD